MERPYLSAIHEVNKAPENVKVFGGFVVSGHWVRANSGQKLNMRGRVRHSFRQRAPALLERAAWLLNGKHHTGQRRV